jgi:hypothetical protein
MNRSALRKIAKKYGVSVEDVKKDMQHYADEAYIQSDAYARSVDLTDEKPTAANFLSHAVGLVKAQENRG